jgi:TetR/AcrR family transcriptional regulator, mexJK operon transcriptional repressor
MTTTAKRSLVKQQKILEMAAKLFLQNGYEGVSVDEVTRAAGGSKTNVYTYFGGKEGLFTAVVDYLMAARLQPFKDLKVSDHPPEKALKEIGRTFLDIILDEHILALHRLIVAESARFPQLGRAWFAAGPEYVYRSVEGYLEAQQRVGRLRPGNPRRAAALFLDMITFDVHHRTLLGVTPRPGQAELERLVEDAVDTFLHGYMP